MAYIDTCVLGSFYCPESMSAAVNRRIVGLTDTAISKLVEVEFYSLLAQKVRTKEMTRFDGMATLGKFRANVADGMYQFVDIGPREHEIASIWLCSFNTSLRALDALHLASASTHEQMLLTTDKVLAQAAMHLGVQYELIRG